jgi:hypothetical protein
VSFPGTSYEARKLWAASQPTIARNFAAQGLMVLFAGFKAIVPAADLKLAVV